MRGGILGLAMLAACGAESVPAPGPDTLTLELGGSRPPLREVLRQVVRQTQHQREDTEVADVPRLELGAESHRVLPRYAELEPGETLSRLAQRTLGAWRRWPEIAELNGIDDPNSLTTGVRLRLPPE